MWRTYLSSNGNRMLLLLLTLLCGGALSVYAAPPAQVVVYGYVIDANTGIQINGAVVRVYADAESISMTTSQGGYFYGTLPINEDYTTATINVEAPGYGTWTMTNTVLFAGDIRTFPAILLDNTVQTHDGGGLPGALDPEPPPPPRYLQGQSQFQAQEDFAPEFWSHEVIPFTIRVAITSTSGHCGYYDNGVYILYPVRAVETVDFRQYVKNVLPNEWVSTWEPAALEAGAMAAKMYAWWKINIGPRGTFEGQDYDVRADTCDQVYRANSQKISTDVAVDNTFGYIMRKNGEVSRIHYTNRISTCQNAGLTPCMGQHESQAMALEGFSWQEILLFFYEGFDITIADGEIPAAPQNQNLIRNGDFAVNRAFWSRNSLTDYAVYDEGDGNFLAWKGREGETGAVGQTLLNSLPAGSVMEVSLELGNNSNAQKRVRVYLQRYSLSPTNTDAAACEFTIPANTPMRSYVIRHRTTTNWENMRLWLEGRPADNLPDIVTDNVRVRRYDTLNINGTQCWAPESYPLHWWDLTLAGSPFGWSSGNDSLTNPTLSSVGLRYQVAAGSPRLLSPTLVGVNAADYDFVYLKAQQSIGGTTCGAVWFLKPGQTAFRESQRVNFTLTPDNTMQGYIVTMSDNAAWTGPISRLRIDAGCESGGVGSTLTVERVLLWDDPIAPQSPGNIVRQAPENNATVTDPIAETGFSWSPDPYTLWYHVYIAGPDAVVVDQWVEAAAVCEETACTLPDTYLLENGRHSWWMAGWSLNGYGAYNETTFQVNMRAPGVISRQAPAEPLAATFQWQPRSDTLWYHLYIVEPSGDVLINRWLEAAQVCDEALCTLGGVYELDNGWYDWWMAGWNRIGVGEYDNFRFNVAVGIPDLIVRTPPATQQDAVFAWQPDPVATWYHVWLGRDGAEVINQWYEASQICDDALCQLPPRDLAGGAYSWWMAGWGPGGLGQYDEVTFSFGVNLPGLVARIQPTADSPITTGQIPLQWTPDANATWYRIYLMGPDEFVYDRWVDGAVACVDALCTQNIMLDTPGAYDWWMTAWGPDGFAVGGSGGWDMTTFTVE